VPLLKLDRLSSCREILADIIAQENRGGYICLMVSAVFTVYKKAKSPLISYLSLCLTKILLLHSFSVISLFISEIACPIPECPGLVCFPFVYHIIASI
jgi:hypothetical protein